MQIILQFIKGSVKYQMKLPCVVLSVTEVEMARASEKLISCA